MFVLKSTVSFLIVVLSVGAQLSEYISIEDTMIPYDFNDSVTVTVLPTVHLKSENITFMDVRVIGYNVGNPISPEVVPIAYATNLNKISKCLDFETIDDIRGPLHTLYENSVTDLPNLRTFRKTFESLKHIEPGAFKNLSNLETLIITFTKLTEVKEGVFNDLKIKTLYLHGNDISQIDTKAFDNMTELRVLSMFNNNLTQWDKNWFYNTPKLTHLHFSYNKFEELPERAFGNLKNGKIVLNFKLCGIKKLGNNLFGGNKEVGVLDLSHNKIKVFGDHVLDGVENMKKLILINNKITCFSNLDKVFVAKLTEAHHNPIVCGEECSESLQKKNKQMSLN